MRLERRSHVPLALALAAPLIAITVALLLAGLLIAAAGVSPLDAYAQLFVSAFGSRLSVTETLTRAAPLILTGLAAAVAFRARVWNIGGEGQFYLGALAAAALGAHGFGLPPVLHMMLMMLAGAAAGLLLLLGPLALRVRFGVDEVVTTLLLNFVVILFVSMMIEGPMKDPMAFGWPQSVPIARDYALPSCCRARGSTRALRSRWRWRCWSGSSRPGRGSVWSPGRSG
ncbi:Branched-chain amino acid transport system / permease component [Methylobrevis pamukkalensis]|uniref:Branched-chain amino acid transport system / permease component n=1 Tax=Methylobrevis pamukkalensis TaxID=1439726 RepID=A0A1E3H5T1_9HYPH|nr:Branched-chain amino acid transport system / permease component [Methylobrevis pamukkalensis]